MNNPSRGGQTPGWHFPLDVAYEDASPNIHVSRCMVDGQSGAYHFETYEIETTSIEEWLDGSHEPAPSNYLVLQEIIWIPVVGRLRPRRCPVPKATVEQVVDKLELGPAYGSAREFVRGYAKFESAYLIKFGDFISLAWSHGDTSCATRAVFWGPPDYIVAAQAAIKSHGGPAYHHESFVALMCTMTIQIYIQDELETSWVGLGSIEKRTSYTNWETAHIPAAEGDLQTLSSGTTGIKACLAARECYQQTATALTKYFQQRAVGSGARCLGDPAVTSADACVSDVDRFAREILHRLEEHKSTIQYYHQRADAQLTAIFHLIAQEDSQISIALAKESKTLARSSMVLAEVATRDANAMKALALVALIFLPPTVIAAIFTMPFFDWSERRTGPLVSRGFWIYCLTTVVLTLITVAVWILYIKRTDKRKWIEKEKDATNV